MIPSSVITSATGFPAAQAAAEWTLAAPAPGLTATTAPLHGISSRDCAGRMEPAAPASGPWHRQARPPRSIWLNLCKGAARRRRHGPTPGRRRLPADARTKPGQDSKTPQARPRGKAAEFSRASPELPPASLCDTSIILRNDVRNLGRGCNSCRLHYLGQLLPPESQ